MKTLVKDGISLYVFSDEVEVTLSENKTTVGNPPDFFISDCNATNTEIHAINSVPVDWIGGKYLFLNSSWSLNPDYVDISELKLIEKKSL
jgi:hypothetical protein